MGSRYPRTAHHLSRIGFGDGVHRCAASRCRRALSTAFVRGVTPRERREYSEDVPRVRSRSVLAAGLSSTAREERRGRGVERLARR